MPFKTQITPIVTNLMNATFQKSRNVGDQFVQIREISVFNPPVTP